LLVIMGAVAWLGVYNQKAFGNPLILPYTIDQQTYSMAPYFIWQHLRPEPVYPDQAMCAFYTYEIQLYKNIHSLKGFLPWTLAKTAFVVPFYTGFCLLPPIFMIRRVFLDRRIRFLVISVLVLAGGMSMVIFLVPYYLAAFTVALYAIGLQMMRHLRVYKSGRSPVGIALVRFTMAACVIMAGVRVIAEPLHLGPAEFSPANWNDVWYGPQHFGVERVAIEKWLEGQPGQQLVIVRYADNHHFENEWVYNSASIESAKVLWARDMGYGSNQELIRYYANRKVWLVEPDAIPARISSYPTQESK
ncbi:MAG: hypothetical protein ACRD3S_03515, partial [Terracidiphilus sp.]